MATNIIEKLDAQLAVLLSDWGGVSTLLAVLIAALVVYPIIYPEEPDTHPLLLARQASISPVRNKNESAIYRSPEVPHGYPLKTGLGVKDEKTPRWATGKDGDLRDVWREVQRGGKKDREDKDIPKGLIMTVLGVQETIEHDVTQLSKEIQILGQHIKASGAKKVAIYLPNNVEYLLAIFACAFYGRSPILLPYNVPHPKVYELLDKTGAEALICAAGSLPLDDVAQECKNLRLLTWVVEKTSRHMDWNGVPDSAQGRLNVSVWHDVVQENQEKANGELPINDTGDDPADLFFVWQPTQVEQKPQIVTFSQTNMAAAISALISAIPSRQRFSPADLVLPASAFNISYVLCQTMATLYTHANLAITSVAQPGVDLALATRGVSPTVIIASAESMVALHTKETAAVTSATQKLGKYSQSQAMAAGRMPASGMLFSLISPSTSTSGNTPGKLRLILTSERLGAGTPRLTSAMLSDLRIFTRARICYALTAAQVAGAVAQTNVFDYRREEGNGCSHFGIPLSSVEVKVAKADDSGLGDAKPTGEIVVSGPAVSGGGDVKLGVQGVFREDGTLALV